MVGEIPTPEINSPSVGSTIGACETPVGMIRLDAMRLSLCVVSGAVFVAGVYHLLSCTLALNPI